jgi:transcriptional regulator with XRE-family HTH domain
MSIKRDKEGFSKRVLALRLEFGLTQEQLSEKIGCTRGTINRIERAHKYPRASTRFKLAQFFGTDENIIRKSELHSLHIAEPKSDYNYGEDIEIKALRIARKHPKIIEAIYRECIMPEWGKKDESEKAS